MRICANCGAEIEEGTKFCAHCGTPVPPEESADQTEETTDNTEVSTDNAEAAADNKEAAADNAETAADNADPSTDNAEKPGDGAEKTAEDVDADNEETNKNNPKMRWYRFIINAGLFLAVIFLVVLAALCATGFMYLNDWKSIYTLYPGMQALNIFMAAFYVIMAILAIVVRQRLAHYRKNGPRIYIKWMWAVLIGWIEYEAVTCMIAGRLMICTTTFAIREFAILTGVPVLIMALYILINMFYFHRRKRRELFT